MSWIIQLCDATLGERYVTLRGKGVTMDRDKAKIFIKKDETELKMNECDLWPERKLISLD